jgi:hypothetical protein
MSITPKDLEDLWDDLLSRQPKQVRSAFAALDLSDQKMVLAHLERMARETGWQPEQRASAVAALKALENQSHKGK